MSNNKKNVPDVVIKRLPRYYRYLDDLLKQGITRISSAKLSEKMKVTASQIRQDFNYFGGFGQQGYGYNVEYLYNEIAQLLGLKDGYKAVIIGAGHLGLALVNHSSFEKRGFNITALFDIDEEKLQALYHRGRRGADRQLLQRRLVTPHPGFSRLHHRLEHG